MPHACHEQCRHDSPSESAPHQQTFTGAIRQPQPVQTWRHRVHPPPQPPPQPLSQPLPQPQLGPQAAALAFQAAAPTRPKPRPTPAAASPGRRQPPRRQATLAKAATPEPGPCRCVGGDQRRAQSCDDQCNQCFPQHDDLPSLKRRRQNRRRSRWFPDGIIAGWGIRVIPELCFGDCSRQSIPRHIPLQIFQPCRGARIRRRPPIAARRQRAAG